MKPLRSVELGNCCFGPLDPEITLGKQKLWTFAAVAGAPQYISTPKSAEPKKNEELCLCLLFSSKVWFFFFLLKILIGQSLIVDDIIKSIRLRIYLQRNDHNFGRAFISQIASYTERSLIFASLTSFSK